MPTLEQYESLFLAVISDLACVVEPTLVRCECNGCKRPATVKHIDLELKACDRCAAVRVVQAQHELNSNSRISDATMFVRMRVADDECWEELPNADRIRRLSGFADLQRRRDEPDPPTNPAEYH